MAPARRYLLLLPVKRGAQNVWDRSQLIFMLVSYNRGLATMMGVVPFTCAQPLACESMLATPLRSLLACQLFSIIKASCAPNARFVSQSRCRTLLLRRPLSSSKCLGSARRAEKFRESGWLAERGARPREAHKYF